MDRAEIIKALREAECDDPFECIFGMFGKSKNGYGCFALYPNGDPNEPKQKCVAHQAADLIESLIEENNALKGPQERLKYMLENCACETTGASSIAE